MSTSSNIAIAINSVDAQIIYCNFDGYQTGVGRILKLYYSTPEKVEQLIDMGDMSSIGKFIGEKHDFSNCPDGECNFYGRDRGEDNVDAWTRVINNSWKGSGCDYDYLFKPSTGLWYVRQTYANENWRVLTDKECGITEQDRIQAEQEIAEHESKKNQHKDLDAMLDVFLAKF